MILIEFIYKIKKSIINFYRKYFTTKGVYTCILPDSIYLRMLYKERMGKKLNLRHPVTYTEKLQWLKLHDRKPEYTMMVDKYAVRKYIADTIGEKYLVPLIGVWDRVEDIDFDALPDKFVLKCNHDNGVIICKDKSKLDIEATKKDLQYHLNRDYYKKGREWPYKNVKRKIICEAFMEDEKQKENGLYDYKFFCFNGVFEIMFIAAGRSQNNTSFDYYDKNYNHLDIVNGHPNSLEPHIKPSNFDKMIKLSEKISSGYKQMRVDFYEINGQIYFGEITLFHYGGFHSFEPEEIDYELGKLITL